MAALGLRGLASRSTEQLGAGGCGSKITTSARLTATLDRFSQPCLVVPSDTPFAIELRNLARGQPYNVSIYTVAHPCTITHYPSGLAVASCSPDNRVFQGPIVTGLGRVTYRIDGLGAGTYYFFCDAVPSRMHGVLLVRTTP